MIVSFSDPLLQSFLEQWNSDISLAICLNPKHELSKTRLNSRE